MPRRDAFVADGGDDGIGPPERFNFQTTNLHNNAFFHQQDVSHEEDPELIELERRLNEEVDEEFFEEPRKFNTLQRVIDVLGLQMIDDSTFLSGAKELEKNPAYRQLKGQQQIVEGAIEHMAVIHCADLNGSVIQVGRVARQFSEAVSKVRSLRKQVRDIQDSLGAQGGGAANPNEATAANPNVAGGGGAGGANSNVTVKRSTNAASMSLRELWLKKLECEATLSLLEKLDVIRAAPAKFDSLIKPPLCRIGAGVLTLSDALETMFSDDVAQVQALHRIMEQLFLRKQKAEEIIWDTLHDVIFLRTGNGLSIKDDNETKATRDSSSVVGGGTGKLPSGAHSVSSDSRRSGNRVSFRQQGRQHRHHRPSSSVHSAGTVTTANGMVNPFVQRNCRFALDEDINDDDSVDSTGSGASLFSQESDDEADSASVSGGASTGPGAAATSFSDSGSRTGTGSVAGIVTGGGGIAKRMMIPIPLIEAELDLEEDERRCLEEIALSSMANRTTATDRSTGARASSLRQRQLPKYADSVLATRILVECLFKLKRLDDVERVLAEGLHKEITRILQREQARTFLRLEKKRVPRMGSVGQQKSGITNSGSDASLQEFRLHLMGILSAFGCVMIRLSHLAEILRHRVAGDKELLQKIGNPSAIMRPLLSSAYDIMQREIKTFLKACLRDLEPTRSDPMDASRGKGSSAYESGLFSLGIVETNEKAGGQSVSTATRSHVMEMSTTKFVSNVLLPMTRTEPQIRHALTFRRMVARWTAENDALKNELAALTFEDTSSPSFQLSPEESAISFLDGVIQKELLPVLQEEAVNGTIKGLEHRDAFDPVLDRTLYSRPNSNEPQDVDMCKACQAMYDSTGPLFLALHRLPQGGEMYLPLVAVLEHVMLTFISRVKQQVGRICNGKTALVLLSDEDKPASLSSMLERRRPFSLLLRAYSDGDSLEASPSADELGKQAGLMPLSPSEADTSPRQELGDMKTDTPMEELGDGVEGEELVMELELKSLKEYMNFDLAETKHQIVVTTDEELVKASCLAHSLLKLSSLLESRLRVRGARNKTLSSTRTLQEAIKTIKRSGIKMAKFCRLEILMQAVIRLAKVPQSSTIVARDAVRIPSSVNDLGEALMSASDNIRESAGNAVTAYALSSLEQYIPFCLMQAVRVVAAGKGIVAKSPLTMNGIEALDRSGSVLYRDLKGATSFDNSFWDVELAAISFERSASFIAMMELEMEELVAYYSANQEDFSEEDFLLMFGMTGPRRRGDVGQYHMMKRRLK